MKRKRRKKSELEQWVEKHNALQPKGTDNMPVSKAVEILVKMGYLNLHNRRVECVEGDILVTTPEYAQSIIEEGYAQEREKPGEPEKAPPPGPVLVTEMPPVSDDLAALLMALNLQTSDDLQAEDDKELLRIAGLGPKTLAKIRAWEKDHYSE